MENKNVPRDLLDLGRECHVFGRFLVNEVPNAYVVERYQSAHKVDSALTNVETSHFDRILLRIATVHPFITRVVDSYCRVFFPAGLVRKKCVLLLAILECSPNIYERFDVPDSKSKALLCAEITQRAVSFAFMICLGMLVLLPLHWMFGRRGR